MARTFLFLIGTASAFFAWTLISNRARASRKPIPARQAAALLQQAWADHRTRA